MYCNKVYYSVYVLLKYVDSTKHVNSIASDICVMCSPYGYMQPSTIIWPFQVNVHQLEVSQKPALKLCEIDGTAFIQAWCLLIPHNAHLMPSEYWISPGYVIEELSVSILHKILAGVILIGWDHYLLQKAWKWSRSTQRQVYCVF